MVLTRRRHRPRAAHLPGVAVGPGLRRLGWGVADQGLSALGNFLLFVIAARSVDARQFGAFTLAVATYGILTVVNRALAMEPLLIRLSGGDPEQRAAARSASGAATALAVAEGAVVAAVGVALDGPVGTALVALGALLPALACQDALRYVAFARHRPAAAFASDLVWTSLEVPLMVAVVLTGRAGAAWLIVAWGAASVPGALIGGRALRTGPDVRGARSWLTRHLDLAPHLTADSLIVSGAGRAVLFLVALSTSVVQVAVLRAAQVLYGPVNVLTAGVQALGLAELNRERSDPRRLAWATTRVSGLLAATAALWTVVLVAFGESLGPVLLGDIWDTARGVILPVGVHQVASGASLGPFLGLRVREAATDTVRLRLVVTVVLIVAGFAGAVAAGARGAAVGMAGGQVLTTAWVWRAWRHHTAPRSR
ncbi:MAG: hypothetical protein KY434_01450 [Actinobacteria bacterium]|nr:hypothetical protein [Actinomycetota bacterium]